MKIMEIYQGNIDTCVESNVYALQASYPGDGISGGDNGESNGAVATSGVGSGGGHDVVPYRQIGGGVGGVGGMEGGFGGC